MNASRELPSHVLRRHVCAATRTTHYENSPCAAMFALLCAGPLPALVAVHHGNSDYRQCRRTTAAGE